MTKAAAFALVALIAPMALADSVNQIGEDFYQYMLKESTYLQLKHGLKIESLPDLTEKHAKEVAAFQQSLLDRLAKLPADSLAGEDRISYEWLKWSNATAVEGSKYFWFTSVVTPYASTISGVTRIFREFEFKDAEDLARYRKLLDQYPGYVQQIEQHLREQLKRKIVLPQDELAQAVPFVQSIGAGSSASVFSVSGDRIKNVAEADTAAFQKEVAATIDTKIVPAVKSLVDFLRGEYKKNAPPDVGLSQYPGGKDYYRFLVRETVTYDITPEEIHKTGLKMVEDNEAAMLKIQQELGFKGTPQEFRAKLAVDPRFTPASPEQIGEVLMSYIHRIEPVVDSYFDRRPKAPYGVRRLDPALEGSQTFGYYQEPTPTEPEGIYFYNGSNVKDRSLLLAGSLIYHELIPGHHFQLALQSENTSLPDYRREGYATAYIEGWGEYSSGLAGEMGMYRDPYEKYGRLAAEIFLICRLVVDTGMNYLGWPRSKAVQYMKEHTLLSDREINTETLRYSTDIPGQALAYKMGCNRFRELRETARKELGDQFDIRKFHDAVLGSGALPMSVLELKVRDYINTARQ